MRSTVHVRQVGWRAALSRDSTHIADRGVISGRKWTKLKISGKNLGIFKVFFADSHQEKLMLDFLIFFVKNQNAGGNNL